MRGILRVVTLALVLNADRLLQPQASQPTQPLNPSGSYPDERDIVKRLQAALSSTEYAVRLYFHGVCGADGGSDLQFPQVEVLAPEGNTHGVSAIREMFRNDKNVMISVEPSNIVRITIGPVYKPILDTRLSSVKLPTTAQFNPGGPGGAIDVLESATPVQEAMRENLVHQEPAFYIGLEQPPSRKGHHLPSSMGNLSLDQALDAVAKAFPGIVVYGECENHGKGHTVDIKFDWYQSR